MYRLIINTTIPKAHPFRCHSILNLPVSGFPIGSAGIHEGRTALDVVMRGVFSSSLHSLLLYYFWNIDTMP